MVCVAGGEKNAREDDGMVEGKFLWWGGLATNLQYVGAVLCFFYHSRLVGKLESRGLAGGVAVGCVGGVVVERG